MKDLADDESLDDAIARLRHVFADSSEIISAFIGYARGSEIPPTMLVEAADRLLDSLNRYSTGMREIRFN